MFGAGCTTKRDGPSYFGLDGARTRFLHFFPGGFGSDQFVKAEREYKLAAKTKLDGAAPLASAREGSGFGEAVFSAFAATNLLSPFEKMHIREALLGASGDAFIRAAARLALGETAALAETARILRPYDSAKWTIVTYLPFLWAPRLHMFLKPEVTKDFAIRVGHPFAAVDRPRLDTEVYESLLDLVNKTRAAITSLEPRDNIDLQSFIWVMGDYKEGVDDKPV